MYIVDDEIEIIWEHDLDKKMSFEIFAEEGQLNMPSISVGLY